MSLPLKVDGKWSKLPYGQSVSGHACVKGGFEGDSNEPTLYTIGGISESPTFTGLQRYSFKRKVWESIRPDVPDTAANLQYHAVSYLSASSSLLVFAGSRDGSDGPSSRTFTIDTADPYHVEAYNSYVPPAVSPNLLTWDDEKAVMVGGGPTNDEVYTFSSGEGWVNAGVKLENPLPDVSQVRCALVNGNDGSKVLETFDMSASPNTVDRIVLLGVGGAPADPGTSVGAPSSNDGPPPKRQKRDLSLADYPPYNDKLAPTITRNGFQLAQDSNNWVVLSGGNAQEPLSIFDQSENKWVNATRVFTGVEKNIFSSATTDSTATSTATSSSSTNSKTASTTATTTSNAETTGISSTTSGSSATSTTNAAAAVSSGADKSDTTKTIVGATLGGVFGLAALLVIILILLRWKRKKNQGQGDDYKSNGKDRFSFQDQGIQPLSKAAEPMARSPVPMARGPAPSIDSMAIISGNVGGEDSISRNPPRGFAQPMNEKTLSPLAAPPMRHESSATAPSVYSQNGLQEGDRRTDVGWSKYFQGNSATNLVVMESARSTVSSQETRSDYRGDAWPHESAEVPPPLNLGRIDEPNQIASVNSGSPAPEYADDAVRALAVQPGMTARITSGYTASEDSYEDDHPDAYSSGVPASVTDMSSPWGPMNHGGHEPSSRYTESTYPSGLNNLQFPPVPKLDRPVTQWPGWEAENANGERGPSSILRNHYDGDQKRGDAGSDMSWLNLGSNNYQSRPFF